ncbi:MAG: GIY-YIG nuclease family protein [Cyclobacteriaceae bacterium]|nr:GIY-YIG nuclease family protein [Cyclobacteriaceae bacterium]
MFTVYVLFSKQSDKIYIGYTSDLESRLLSHNQLAKKGYTIKYRPWILVHSEVFDNKSNAIRRERELKSARGRMYIRQKLLDKL